MVCRPCSCQDLAEPRDTSSGTNWFGITLKLVRILTLQLYRYVYRHAWATMSCYTFPKDRGGEANDTSPKKMRRDNHGTEGEYYQSVGDG
jgi:hypothetical protein